MSKRLLVVDDEEAILYAYKRLFGRSSRVKGGVVVDAAKDLDEAKAFLKEHKYQVIVTDLRLGIEDDFGGFELIDILRGYDKDIKIVMVTAYGNPKVKAEAMRKGADYYLEKPVPLDVLKGILKELGI